ncbi:MAG TPA: ABC transporter ATP-binding protein [Cytophagaceae bacterium]
MKALRHLNKYLYKYRIRLGLGILFIILSNFFSTVQGPVIREVIDYLTSSYQVLGKITDPTAKADFSHEFMTKIAGYGITILVMALVSGVFLYFQRQTIIGMSRYVEFDLKNEIYAHYQSLPLAFYRKNNTGDLMNRISEDVSQVRMYLGPSIMYFINLLALFFITITIMFSVDVKLSFYVLIPLPILTLSIYLVHNTMDKRSDEVQKGLSKMSTYVQEAFSGIRVLKAFVREKDSYEKFVEESNTYKDKSLKLASINAFFFPLIVALTGLSVIIIVYYGGKEVIAGNITYGNITEFIFYLNKLTWPVASLGWTTSLVQRAEVSQRRINEFLNTKTDIISNKNLDVEIKGHIVFDKVSFIYPESGIEALREVSFEIKAGESVAIVGGTGSGKSTIANLVGRLYDVTDGRILVDGNDIKDFNINSLRNQVGYVPQDVFLFSDTIKNNIAFGSENLSNDDMLQASKDADLYDNIKGFPLGFETILGERGITLSGGQKQRLSIARAIARNPRILILDDCLSAVDTKTENAILNNLQGIMQDKTTLIISHRVSSVKLANKIMVLENGIIAEEGTHDVLMARNGIYKDLYTKQLMEEKVGLS